MRLKTCLLLIVFIAATFKEGFAKEQNSEQIDKEKQQIDKKSA
jgi:hypothetical protein